MLNETEISEDAAAAAVNISNVIWRWHKEYTVSILNKVLQVTKNPELAEKAKKKGKRNATDRQIKELKTALGALHAEVKKAESYYKHIQWLQERFPRAEYEDVTGLCKSATPQEVKEQDYSLNPGRYVGVVIEEDGRTEEEFVEELLAMNQELSSLNREASELEKIIHHNILQLTGEK